MLYLTKQQEVNFVIQNKCKDIWWVDLPGEHQTFWFTEQKCLSIFTAYSSLLRREPVKSRWHMGQNSSHLAWVIYNSNIYIWVRHLELSLPSTLRKALDLLDYCFILDVKFGKRLTAFLEGVFVPLALATQKLRCLIQMKTPPMQTWMFRRTPTMG